MENDSVAQAKWDCNHAGRICRGMMTERLNRITSESEDSESEIASQPPTEVSLPLTLLSDAPTEHTTANPPAPAVANPVGVQQSEDDLST